MKYGTISGLDKPVSRLVLGCADLKNTALLDAALDAGINTFDTAHQYGGSEALLGGWLRGKDLDKLVIETKGCHPSPLRPDRVTPACLVKDVETSLRRLGVECIDLFLLHRDSLRAEVGELVETLNHLRRQGKLRAFGGSNWTAERIREANSYAAAHGLTPFTVSSPHFGLACQVGDPWGGGAGCVTLTGEGQERQRAWYRESGTAVLAFSSLARGLLSGKLSAADPARADKLDAAGRRGYDCPENWERLSRAEALAREKGCTVAQIALAWLFRQDINAYAVFSTSSAPRIAENCGALDVALTREECRWMNLEETESGGPQS